MSEKEKNARNGKGDPSKAVPGIFKGVDNMRILSLG